MDENDFIVGIQAILTKAKESGWRIERITEIATMAIEEFEIEAFNAESGDPTDDDE